MMVMVLRHETLLHHHHSGMMMVVVVVVVVSVVMRMEVRRHRVRPRSSHERLVVMMMVVMRITVRMHRRRLRDSDRRGRRHSVSHSFSVTGASLLSCFSMTKQKRTSSARGTFRLLCSQGQRPATRRCFGRVAFSAEY
jgi:hypothetical protein